MKTTTRITAIVTLLFTASAFAGEQLQMTSPLQSAQASPSLYDRETLNDDWFGFEPIMRERGISLSLSHTSFGGGLLKGEGSHSWDYAGKMDAFIRVDGAKLGLWNGFGINAHVELNHGSTNQFVGGTLLPNNIGTMFPGSTGTVADLSLYVTQHVGQDVTLMLGKINTVDLYSAGREFTGGRGVEKFQHLEFTAPTSGITPPMILGGIISVKTDPAKFTLMIYDPFSASRRSGFEDPFADGVTFNGSVELPSNFLGKSGKHVFSSAYSTQDGTDFSDPNIFLPSVTPATKDDRWYFSYGFEQPLWRDAINPKKAWGLFGQTGISDGNPNPVEWSVLGGIGGTSPIPGRERDKFGFGAFYLGFSGDLKTTIQPVAPLRDEYGSEIFYNYAVTPWLRVTADLQVIRPGLDDRDTAFVGVLRTQVLF